MTAVRIALVVLLPATTSLTPAPAPGEEVRWVGHTKLVASDPGGQDTFGRTLAIDGDRLLVGADRDGPLDTGALYVFDRGGAGGWTETVKLIASDPGPADDLGSAVGLSGDTAAGLAPGADDGVGAVYVFERDPVSGEWLESAKLVRPDRPEDPWGASGLALDGDLIAVGFMSDDEAATNAGAVYVFERDAGGPGAWGAVAKLFASDATTQDLFGSAVGLDGDRMVVGARKAEGEGPESGVVYVFERNADGEWVETAKLQASDAVGGEAFGWALGIDGDRVVVGAQFDGELGNDAGAAHIFERAQGDEWVEVIKLLPPDGNGGWFGSGVGISGDGVVVGAKLDSVAYMYERDLAGAWLEVARLEAPDGDDDDQLGSSAAIFADTVVVGAPLADIVAPPLSNEGAAYVWVRVSPVLALSGTCPGAVTLTLTGASPGDPVAFLWSDSGGFTPLPGGPCAGTEVGLADPRPLGVRPADGRGEIEITRTLPEEACGRLVQAVDGATCLVSGVVAIP